MRALAALLLLVVACTSGDPGPRPAEGPVELPRSMAAIGDSTTRAFLLCSEIGDCPEASWATGTAAEVDSHAARLGRLAGRPVESHNLAVSGARVADLAAQADRAVETGAEYVTVLIGVNDACRGSADDMTPVAEYAAAFDRAMTTLVRGLPEAKVLVVSNPDLLRLWDVGKDRPEVRARWQALGLCQSLLAPDAPRERVRERVVAYNDAMAATCAKHPTCRWDGGAVFRYRFGIEAVSPLDYWHPSRTGQHALSEISWNAGWYRD